MKIKKIVITGGPCAGKTTAMGRIQKEFEKIGYCVLFVPETATELITGGVAPWTCASNEEYQQCQILLQKGKEKIFERAAAKMAADKILIVCDRGVMDNKAYMNDQEFENVMKALDLNEIEERDRYDAVFHLVTAAKGALQAYTLANNAARIETPEQAAQVDEKLIAAWTGHPYLRVVDNSTSFEEKMDRLVLEIAAFLGEKLPVAFERKYLIRYPDMAALEAMPNVKRYISSRPTFRAMTAQRSASASAAGKESTFTSALSREESPRSAGPRWSAGSPRRSTWNFSWRQIRPENLCARPATA